MHPLPYVSFLRVRTHLFAIICPPGCPDTAISIRFPPGCPNPPDGPNFPSWMSWLLPHFSLLRRWTWTVDFKCREVKTGFCRKRWTQTGSSGTLIGWKSGQTTFIPLWDRMEGAWLWTLDFLTRLPANFSLQDVLSQPREEQPWKQKPCV